MMCYNELGEVVRLSAEIRRKNEIRHILHRELNPDISRDRWTGQRNRMIDNTVGCPMRNGHPRTGAQVKGALLSNGVHQNGSKYVLDNIGVNRMRDNGMRIKFVFRILHIFTTISRIL